MGFRRYRLGMEWTDSLFKLVELHQRRGRVRVTEAVVHPLPPGWLRNGEIVEPDHVIQAIREALEGKKLHTRKVRIAVGGSHVRVMRRRLPELGKRKLCKWIRDQVLAEAHLPWDDPVFDYYRVGHVWEDGGEQDAVIVTASRRMVSALASLAEWGGLEPVGLEPAPLGLARWLSYALPEVFSNRMTVQVSPRSVEVSFFEGEIWLETRSISLSMEPFAEGERLRDPPGAPLLKEEEEVRRYGEALSIALREVLESFRERAGWLPREWVLTGEGVDFTLLRDRLKPEEGVSVTISPFPGELLAEGLRERIPPSLGPSLSVPIGLWLDGGMSV